MKSENVNPGKVGLVAENLSVQQEESDGVQVRGKALPFGEVSRNGVQYSRESVEENADTMIGCSILFNHQEDEVIGHVTDVEVMDDGLYYEADLNPEHRFVEDGYIERGDISNVSIQAIIDPHDGDTPLVDVLEFLELSMVTVPGFDDADVAEVEAVPEGVATVESFVGESVAGEPMGEYDDFEACVADNQDKDDPEAYCGAIKDRAEEYDEDKVEVRDVDGDAEDMDDPCWDGYTMVGTKPNGNPRCVPDDEVDNFDGDESGHGDEGDEEEESFDDAADVIRMYVEQALNEIEAEFGEETVQNLDKQNIIGEFTMTEEVSDEQKEEQEESTQVSEAVELDSVLSVVERHMNQLMEDLESMEMEDEEPEDDEDDDEEMPDEEEEGDYMDDEEDDEEAEESVDESEDDEEESEESVDDEESEGDEEDEVAEESVDEEEESDDEDEVEESATSARSDVYKDDSSSEDFKGRLPSIGG